MTRRKARRLRVMANRERRARILAHGPRLTWENSYGVVEAVVRVSRDGEHEVLWRKVRNA